MQCLQTTAQERRVTFRGLLFPLLGDEQIPRTLGTEEKERELQQTRHEGQTWGTESDVRLRAVPPLCEHRCPSPHSLSGVVSKRGA